MVISKDGGGGGGVSSTTISKVPVQLILECEDEIRIYNRRKRSVRDCMGKIASEEGIRHLSLENNES